MAIQELLTSRNNLISDADTYVGQVGRIFFDLSTRSLRLSDGVTPGGINISGGNGGSIVTISDTNPPFPMPSDLWWDTNSGRLKIYYQDNNGSRWVDATPAGGGGGNGEALVAVSDTAPVSYAENSLWWNSSDGELYIRYSNAWVAASQTYNGNVYVNLSDLKSIVAASTTFDDFKTAIAAL